jgi:hypothetical protein
MESLAAVFTDVIDLRKNRRYTVPELAERERDRPRSHRLLFFVRKTAEERL